MQPTRRSLLQLLGLGTAATITGIKLGATPSGLEELNAALEAGYVEGNVISSAPLVINTLNLDPWLSDKAKAAAANVRKLLIWEYDHQVRTYPGASPDEECSDFVRCHSPCQFVTKTFYNDGLPSGAVPETLAKEWAKMLNHLAEKGWEASFVPAGSIQLATPANLQVDLDLTAWRAEVGLPAREPRAWTPEEKRPRVAVFSFIFFRDPEGKLATPAQFNARFGQQLAVLESEVAVPQEPSSFRWA